MNKPDLVAINHDDYHASNIGRVADGRQFFLTTPFIPAVGGSKGREFVALYLFDKLGKFLEARIEDMGIRAEFDEQRISGVCERLLAELGPVEHCRIEVKPFEVQRFGATFGLVPRPPEEDGDDWWVVLLPGDYMTFSEPFDSGDYDT